METFPWNEGWRFTPAFSDALAQNAPYPGALEAVRIPHTVKQLPYNYANEKEYQMVSGYRREFDVPENWRGKRVLLRFGAVAHEAVIFCNGKEVARHACGYTAFTADLSAALLYGGHNVVAVRCDSRESLDVPPFGLVIDYMTYGGIYRGVTLTVKDSVGLDDVFITAGADGGFHIYPTVSGEAVGCALRADVTGPDGRAAGHFSGTATSPLSGAVPGAAVWSPEQPMLYTFTLSLVRLGEGGLPDRVLEEKRLRVGFRTIDFRADGLYLNGRRIVLRGLDRHQSWPYQGYAMPDSLQRLDAELLKNTLGCNAVRTSHYPQSHAFLDACDELGLLVFTEMPGWQHIGGDAWKQQAIANCREMILEYRNHPSIFLWGVRINESADDDAFYQATNELAHRLDPTRPTGGVRCIKHSHCFEDVYTYNDFVHTGKNPGCEPKRAVTSDLRKGYLISEHNGHMYPTKAFDWEEKRLEHALRHARVLNDSLLQKDIAGSFGWCMFDYNTHKDFGSGDRICYHGVMDMFRNPKLAAAVYASQKPVQSDADCVLALSSTMDIGEHPGGALGDVWAFTNADCVNLYKNDEFVAAFLPDRKGRFSALAHPPIAIDDVVGCLLEKHEGFSHAESETAKECLRAVAKYGQNALPPQYLAKLGALMIKKHLTMADATRLYGTYVANWGGKAIQYRFDAVVDGRVVKSVVKEPVADVFLEAKALNPHLCDGPTWDCAAISLRAVDQNGNTLPYCGEAVTVTAEGPLQVLGPCIIPLRGGMAGAYLATQGAAGTALITCTMPGAAPVRLTLEIAKG
ncbi:MAG: glycoside hydrolase family 2 [Faecalibacterium sp.]|jgi:beta-galactosidase|nr:glycoside hydrolase family 2 [Faecalibacterium sp.]